MALSHSVASARDRAGTGSNIGHPAADKSATGARCFHAATASVGSRAEVIQPGWGK